MKKYTLRTVDSEGNTVLENELTLKEGSTLICQIPDSVTLESAQKIHNMVSEALEDNAELITIPFGVQLKVLDIE